MSAQMTLWNTNPDPTGPCPLTLPTLTERPTVLLDLNYTLVANSPLKKQQRGLSYADKILTETYRTWLIDLLKPYRVILWTVRFDRYQEVTLQRLDALNGWQPDYEFFNPRGSYEEAGPPEVKETYLREQIIPTFGAPTATAYFALESNTQTRAMLKRHSIPAVKIGAQDCWTSLPGGDFPPYARG